MDIRLISLKIYQKLLCGNFSNEFDNISDSQERAFCKRLVLTSLRKHEFLRKTINNYTSKQLPQKLAFSHLCIFLGASEILFFSTPKYASVNSYVALAKKDNKFSGGFVNAILRKICQNKEAILQQPNLFFSKSFRQLLQKDYTKSQIDKIENISSQEPPLDITVKNNPEEWAKKLSGHLMPNGSIRLFSAGNIPELYVKCCADRFSEAVIHNLVGARFFIISCNPIFGKFKKQKSSGIMRCPRWQNCSIIKRRSKSYFCRNIFITHKNNATKPTKIKSFCRKNHL